MSTVYLAGPITGCTYEGCTEWREKFITSLTEHGIKGLSPMRGKEYLSSEPTITGSYEEHVLSCQRGIVARDYFDCRRADLIVVNFLGAKRVSIGTVMEIAWAHAHRVPVVLVMEESDNPNDHCMLRECCSYRVSTLYQAFKICVAVLA